jgi:hypothetical protein
MFDQALEMCRQALAISPDHPGGLALLSTLLVRQDAVDEAIAAMERAISLDSSQPLWYSNLCAYYRLALRPDNAVNAAFTALRMAPNVPQFLVNFAVCCRDLDRTDEAVACLLRAIAVESDNAAAHLLLGEILLARGEMRPGWMEYEWRVRVPGQALNPAVPSPVWNGMKLPGARILLMADQGYGDCIQFSRYIRYVAERCEQVPVCCSPELAPLLRNVQGVAYCFSDSAEIPPHAVHCRLSSLPWIFGTEVDTIPESGPYIFADPEKVSVWRKRLDEQTGPGRKRIGLAWCGSPKHQNDRRRSLRLSQLTPLAAAQNPGISFVSLQKPVPEPDRGELEVFGGMLDFSDLLTDFTETAALIACLDLVISVDTSVAHLAGAMGKPTWILLSKAPDWRWFLNRPDSPWYRSIRLFRQIESCRWDAPIRAVADALLEEVRR